MIVEVDERKLGKHRFNRVRLVKGTWVLGMIDLITEIDMEKI